MRRLLLASLLVPLLPVVAGAVARPPEPRLHPRDVSPLPTYVRRVVPSLVALRGRAPQDAPSSARLGAQRFGTGVIFDARGYAVTAGYVVLDTTVLEAETRDEHTVSARLVGIDFDSGLGIVKLDGGGPWPTAALGDSRDAMEGELTGSVSVDEDNDLVSVVGRLEAIHRFSAAWEYMLDRGFFVAPGNPSWAGSAVVNQRGELIAIASLRLGNEPYVNLSIPVEALVAVKDELIAVGRVVSRPPRPWLGLSTAPGDDGPVVEGFSPLGPARSAGFVEGDRIVRVNGAPVRSQEEFYEQLWRARAGDTIEVAVERAGGVRVISVRSVDRAAVLLPAAR